MNPLGLNNNHGQCGPAKAWGISLVPLEYRELGEARRLMHARSYKIAEVLLHYSGDVVLPNNVYSTTSAYTCCHHLQYNIIYIYIYIYIYVLYYLLCFFCSKTWCRRLDGRCRLEPLHRDDRVPNPYQAHAMHHALLEVTQLGQIAGLHRP